MTHWSRKYGKYANEEEFQISRETQRYIEHIKSRTEDTTCTTYICIINCFYVKLNKISDQDDVTQELMNRIEMNNQRRREPTEVRAARKVIQNWLQIEKEANIIRNAPEYSSSMLQQHTQQNIQHIINTTIISTNSKKHYNHKSSTNKGKQHITTSSSTSSFNSKFERMKLQAMNRAKHHQYRPHKKQITEFKEEEEEELIQSALHNAEQKARYDLIPVSRQNKEQKLQKKIDFGKQKYMKRLETKRVLLMQLSEIEKEERYHHKKLIVKIWREWQTCMKISKQNEKLALDTYHENMMKNMFDFWCCYIAECKQITANVFREWLTKRIITQHNEMKAMQFYEDGLEDNIFCEWRQYTKHSIETKKIRAMQIQSRLYKMQKIATRHYHFGQYCKIMKCWKQFVADQQTQRYLKSQRHQRSIKMKKLIASVKEKAKKPTDITQLKIDAKNIYNTHQHHKANKRKQPKHIQNTAQSTNCTYMNEEEGALTETVIESTAITACNVSVQTISHSIQTENICLQTSGDCQGSQTSQKQIQIIHPQRNNKTNEKKSYQIKPSKLVIEMERRATERKEKRQKLIEMKEEKQKKQELLLQQQRKEEMERIRKEKKMEQERKQKILQRQMRIKEIEKEKVMLSQMHHHRSLIIYSGWIPWMKCIEKRNVNYHRIVVLHNHSKQQQVWYKFVCNLCTIHFK